MASNGYDRQQGSLPYTDFMDKSQKSEFVKVARDLKGYVIGRGRRVINEIMDKSGATVSTQSKEEEGFTISGNQEQRECAKKLILQKVEQRRKSEFVEVPRNLKRYVIGTGGVVIKEISQKSGARVSQTMEEEGFTISGNQEQRACARRLILEKVQAVQERNLKAEEVSSGELVEIPEQYKGLVFGKKGKNLKDISTHTGAKLVGKDNGVFIVRGTPEQRVQAKVQIKGKIAAARLREEFTKFCVYIDGSNLPENCEFQLEQVVQGDDVDSGDLLTQYRLKPAEGFGKQESAGVTLNPSYLPKLEEDVLECLRNIKQEMNTGDKADMWCHFGKALIRGPNIDEADEGRWNINEATRKFVSSAGENGWKTALKGGVEFDEKILERHVVDKNPEEYIDLDVVRYDLEFLTPSSHALIFKVWVTKNTAVTTLKDKPVPLGDVKNVVDEIYFEDGSAKSRCRGWLVLPSRKYLRADILFPGCEFDCRFFIRARRDCALDKNYAPKGEERRILSRYLSKLTLSGENGIGICLPEEEIPDGFHLNFKRCSKRSFYEISQGFKVLLSKETSWSSDEKFEKATESTDFHLHCREWDELLDSEDWEPEKIIKKLPEFFQFVKKVQGIVMEKRAPAEIRARGLAAVEAYNKALSHGKTLVKRLPLMLIGQDRAGKTSLKKSLRGICFDPEEDSTDGIEVDPSFFNVSTETWRTGEPDRGQNSDQVPTFDYQTARRIVDSLERERKVRNVQTFAEEDLSISDYESIEVPGELKTIEPSRETENVHKPKDSDPTHSIHIPSVTPDLTEEKLEEVNSSASGVPDEVASLAEALLQRNLEDNGEEIYSTFWDFAGQSVYYVTHPLFLTKKAIYLLVYDLSLNPYDKAKPVVKRGVYKKTLEGFSSLKTNLDYLEFWMTSVASLASTQEEDLTSELLPEKLPPVFLVCTHADTPYCGRDPQELATEIFGSLRSKPYGCHLYDVFFVDNTSLRVNTSGCPEVQRLRKELVSVAKELPQTHHTVPIKWLKFEKVLQVEKEGHQWIYLETAKNIANACGIDEDKEIETMMNYLHDLKSLIHFDDTDELNGLVVLDPQWLIDVFKKVITVKPYHSKEKKKFVDLWCRLEKEGILTEKLLVHAWDSLFDNKETYQNLIEIMKKFSLLCPWPSDDSDNKSYLVPSMLRSHPPEEALRLVETAKIPPLYVKFSNGQVPPDLFPRLVVQFFQWVKDKCQILQKPQLFHEFARFFISPDGDSVILICRSSVIEVVVHGDNHSCELVEHFPASVKLSADVQFENTEVICASAVHRQLCSILECMHRESRWQRDMRYEMSFLCPVCSHGGVVGHCRNHDAQQCKEEECLHFLAESEVRKNRIICTNSPFAPNPKVQVKQFTPWFPSQIEQEARPSKLGGQTRHGAVESDAGNSTRELKITLLASEWNSSMGGLSTINTKLAVLLAKQPQVSVTFLVPQNACSEKERKRASQLKVTIREAEERPGFDDPLDWLCLPPEDLSIDIVVGHGAKLGKQAQFITKSHRCKWVQMVHTVPEELGMYKDYPEAIGKGEMKNRTEVQLCKLAHLVVAVGAKLKEAYSSYLRSSEKYQHIIQLTPGTFDEFKTIKQASQDSEKFKVLTFGRGDLEDFKLKGYDIVPKALAELRDSSYCLVFVGTPKGKQEEVVKRLLQTGISEDQLLVRAFIQDREQLKDLLCEVDLAIMPSRTEGFGLSALEALSAGLPILVSGNSGFGHALRELPLGQSFVVESKDPREWAKAIASVRGKGREQRLKEIQCLRRSYEEKYSWENQCGSLVERLWSMAYADN